MLVVRFTPDYLRRCAPPVAPRWVKNSHRLEFAQLRSEQRISSAGVSARFGVKRRRLPILVSHSDGSIAGYCKSGPPNGIRRLPVADAYPSQGIVVSKKSRTSSACRWVPVFSNMLARCVRAVERAISRCRAATVKPSPEINWARTRASAEVRSKYSAKTLTRSTIFL